MEYLNEKSRQMDELLRADVSQKCPECRGHGADPLSDNLNWLPCRSCGGTGTRRVPDVCDCTPAEHAAALTEANEVDTSEDPDIAFRGEYLLVVRYPNGTVLAERAVPPGEAITTTLREWMLSDDWTGLCEGMTISVERVNQGER